MKKSFSIFPISLKLRLLLTITGVMITGLLVGGSFILHNAREAVEAEITSSFNLAEKLIKGPIRRGIASENASDIPTSIEHLRHVQVIVEHQYMKPTTTDKLTIDNVPSWFVRLVYPRDILPSRLIIHGRGADNVIIAADPADEIQEVWEDVRDLLSLTLILFIITLILTYFAIWQGLKPLKQLQKGFEQLEKNYLDIRISEETVPELVQLHKSFNHMVTVLQRTTHEKQALSSKLVSLQEDERSQISRELHDEVGPYLFSIRVENSTIKQLNAKPHDNKKAIDVRLSSIDQTVEQLQQCIRQLLKKLRPMILNDLPLQDALDDLVTVFQSTSPEIDWSLNYHVDKELPDTFCVTVYRIVQECLTNIGRHAQASRARIMITQTQTPQNAVIEEHALCICAEDNGKGFNGKKFGLGLTGIKERVAALDGVLEISTSILGGMQVNVKLPL